MQGNNIHTETREDSVVRFATTNYRVVEDYAAPSPQSGSALSRAVASSLQEMIAQGAYCMRPVVLREFESASTSGLSFLACLLQKNPSAKVPSVDSVHRFQNCILQVSRTSCDVSIVSLILLKRLIERTGVTFRPQNWKQILLAATIVACKTWGDDEVRFVNADVSAVTGVTEFAVSEINEYERVFLSYIKYDVSVSRSLYSHYYFTFSSKAARQSCHSARRSAIARSESCVGFSSKDSLYYTESEIDSPEFDCSTPSSTQ
eukprot:TRINITY_DN2181_c0_g1_i3.p1 TRINITY_DN2181_c0_g1~~TRINITY_DN2181_c0_g1_i3.p1  ORF type:complete len:261 (+),score=45.66 TRINITY_DN2181_c0_g1_i3:122-904(+)